jgi:hypothetical protein
MKKHLFLSVIAALLVLTGIYLAISTNIKAGKSLGTNEAIQESVANGNGLPEKLQTRSDEIPASTNNKAFPSISGGCSINIQPGQQGPMCPITGCCTPDCSWVRMCCTSHYCKRWTLSPFWPPKCWTGFISPGVCCLEWVTEYWCECYPKTAIPSIVEIGK